MHQGQGTPAPTAAAAASPSSRARRIARRTRDGCATTLANTLCSLLLGLLLIAAVIVFVIWLGLRPHRPRFNIASCSVAGGLDPDSSPAGASLAFNVTDRNPNRHIGIYYDAMHSSVHFYDALVASGPAFAAGWYQPNRTTTSITGLLDVLGPATTDASWPSFSAAVRAGRVPLRLQLTTAIRFRVANAFHSGRQRMHVSCDLLVGADGELLPDSVGAPCDRYI
ncbi:unnamed protein product [Miscanthus lutarioriparius]|uniref:Late embryogenesis abundant protein LEA-2 subgroup domain-containing protein n=1 Tax=Miscanthus lutarioriparius TaxID=422564 RepID=A0A811MPW0_9POAL|nr:unnamed protein product [Miscanthus lutarioriparius]